MSSVSLGCGLFVQITHSLSLNSNIQPLLEVFPSSSNHHSNVFFLLTLTPPHGDALKKKLGLIKESVI